LIFMDVEKGRCPADLEVGISCGVHAAIPSRSTLHGWPELVSCSRSAVPIARRRAATLRSER
jgi:hypothetical protein